jgi:hypothetical protein
MTKHKTAKRRKDTDVVLLRDLSPRQDVTGGAGKLFFGERRQPEDSSLGKRGDLPAKSVTKTKVVKGGGIGPRSR